MFDSSNSDFICLLKDMNLKMLSLIMNKFKNAKLKKEFYEKTIMLINIFYNDKKDWQPLFSILTLYKYTSFTSNGNVFVELGLLNILNNIIDTDTEEIRDLIIKIIDKSLVAEMIEHIQIETILKIFDKFIILIQKYDDIDIGVKDYISCLYNFTNYFQNKPENIKKSCFGKLHEIFQNEAFILHSLNKMIDVRIKFYEVVDHLITDKFTFNKDILEKMVMIAFQGLCFEDNKVLIKTLKNFLLNVLWDKEPEMLNDVYNTFEKNEQIIFYLFLTKNITNVDYLYYPMGRNGEKNSLVKELYKTFFLNDAQQNEIKLKYEQKISNIIPVISLLIKIKTQFIELLFNKLNIRFQINNKDELAEIPLSHELLLFFRIVLYYLLYIENDLSKTLLISDEILQYYSELNNLNEMAFAIGDDAKKIIYYLY